MKEKDIQDELLSIRSMMERSSRFISLSGLSGVMAGIYALIGAGLAYYCIVEKIGFGERFTRVTPPFDSPYFLNAIEFAARPLVIIAIGVLVASLVTGAILTKRKAKRKGQQAWGKTSRSLLFHLAVPLMAGGIFCLILLNRGFLGFIAPATLIFYGLALVSASNYTFGDVKYLGLLEIGLGLVAALLPGYGLLFWAIGFGVLHIIYGSIMYFKYDG